jgi:hypothetical protein
MLLQRVAARGRGESRLDITRTIRRNRADAPDRGSGLDGLRGMLPVVPLERLPQDVLVSYDPPLAR